MSPEEEAKLDQEDQIQIEDIDGWLEAIAAKIAERCPNVQIMASYQTDRDDTVRFFVGKGDYYARKGLAEALLTQMRNEETAQQLYFTIQSAVQDALDSDGNEE